LRVEDVMRRLGCSRATVHRRVADGTLPAVRIKGLVRFRAEVVEALVDASECGAPRLSSEG
jgi:excisionase family DNA binding protein